MSNLFKINEAAERRKLVLQILKYNRGDQKLISFANLQKSLFKLRHSATPDELRAALEYLCGRKFIDVTRRQDFPGFDPSELASDERPDHIVFVKLTPDGVDELEK